MQREESDKGCRAVSVDGPPQADVVAQLQRILASPEFKVSERIRRFLSYVIEETLAGRADRIKAYTIAVEVLGRDANFDLQNDPVVRIEAGRLRRAIERYYLVAGQSDPVLIEIPKGTYVPQFVWRATTQPDGEEQDQRRQPAVIADRRLSQALWPWILVGLSLLIAAGGIGVQLWRGERAQFSPDSRGPERPSLVVMPFVNLSADPETGMLAAGIAEEVLAQLARFKELSVFGGELTRTTASGASRADIRRKADARFVLEGNVRSSGGKLRVASRVLDAETAAVLWSQVYDADLRVSDILTVESDIASKVATAIGQPSSSIFDASQLKRQDRRPDNFEAYRCALRFYRYRNLLTQAEHGATRNCLEQTTKRHPNYATGWAMLSYLYLDEDRFDLNRRIGPPGSVARAREAAKRAVELDPENARALQALMTVLFFDREPAEALRIGEKALALNPNDMELLAEFGSRLAQAGDWKRGSALLDEALARNPSRSNYYVGMRALAAYMLNDDARAVSLIRQADLSGFSIYQLVAALIFSRAGLDAEAAASRDQFLKMRPNFFENFDAELSKCNFNDRDRAVLTEGARRAGFPVP